MSNQSYCITSENKTDFIKGVIRTIEKTKEANDALLKWHIAARDVVEKAYLNDTGEEIEKALDELAANYESVEDNLTAFINKLINNNT